MKFFEIAYRKIIIEVGAYIDFIIPALKAPVILSSFIGVLIAVVLFQLKWYKSSPKLFIFALKLQYAVLPIFLITVVTGLKLIDRTEEFYRNEISENIIPISRMGFPVFQNFINNDEILEDTATYTFEVVLQSFSRAFSKPPNGTAKDKFKMQIANHFAPKFSKWNIEAILHNSEIEMEFGNISQLDKIRQIELMAMSHKFWSNVSTDISSKIKNEFTKNKLKLWLLIFAVLISLVVQHAYLFKNREA